SGSSSEASRQAPIHWSSRPVEQPESRPPGRARPATAASPMEKVIAISERSFFITCVSSPSTPNHLLEVFGVTGALHRYFRRGRFQLLPVCTREFDRGRSKILFQAMHFRRPGNRHDPGLLVEQPSQGHLGGRRLFLCRELTDQVDQPLVRFAVLF